MKTGSQFSTTRNLKKSVLILLPMLILTFVFLSGGRLDVAEPVRLIAFLMTYIFFNFLFFMMLYTGKTDKYRAIAFILFALFLSFTFIGNLLQTRGAMSLSSSDFLACEVPFCHIVTTMIIIPIVFTKSIIFPGSILDGFAPVAGMLVIWIGASLALGKGFCSWGCFYGGWDDGASRILRKPVIKKINPVWKWFPFAVLLIVALSSAIELSPTYCDWVCPFKTVTEFEAVTSITSLIKAIIFVSLFIGLVIVLPILTKKRIQCGIFCPMGALSSFTNKVNVFEIRIDKEKCKTCNLCIDACPTFSLSAKNLDTGKAEFTCVKCGKCIDICKHGAISYHLKGTRVNKYPTSTRTLFLFAAFLFLSTFAGGSFQNGIMMIINLF